ncbi:MAG: class I SAM-dependent methyltransferase, partial [Bacteroidia bacterium]
MKYNKKDSFEYENGFYLTSNYKRTGRLLAHYELYKLISSLEGHIVECGVFKGASLMRFINFIQLFEQNNTFKRKVFGFDVFGKFPETGFEKDKAELQAFIDETGGGVSIGEEELNNFIQLKEFTNCRLIKGDILHTVPKFVSENPNIKIALLNIDTDIFEPCKIIIEKLASLVVKGGVIIFDDYGVFQGETELADKYAE